MDASMDDILQRMGWTTGLQLPLANTENKTLQDEVEKLLLQRARATQFFESEETRHNNITNHLKFVKIQNLENQNLVTTYRQHLDSQEHKLLVTQSEKERVQQEIRHMEKAMEDVEGRIGGKKRDLEKGIGKMEKMKSETSWDSEALQAWEESLKKRDEDNELLKRFSKEDDQRTKELEMKRKNLQVEVNERHDLLTKAIGEVTMYGHTDQRTKKVCKKQKQERAALITQWHEAVQSVRRRDRAIARVARETAMAQDLITEAQEQLDEQNYFLSNEVKGNKEVELQIAELNVTGSKMRRELNDTVQLVLMLNSEANTLKRSLVSTAQLLEKERVKGRNLTKDFDFKERRIQQMDGELKKLEKRLDEVKNSSMSAADRAKQLEEIIQTEQRRTGELNMDVERMQSLLFRTRQNIAELRAAAKIKEIGISGCETATTLLKKHSREVYNNLQKQKEINYDLDFRISQMETKLDKLEGQNVIDEDKQAIIEKLLELEKAFAEENEVKQMIQNQINQIEDEMRRITSAINSDNAHVIVLKDQLQNQVLSFESGIKQSAAAKLKSQQRQVDENIIQLRVNQLEKTVKREDLSVYNLQRFKVEMETAMRERQIEISTNKELLVAKRRNLDEEKGRLKRDIACRQSKIDQLQSRFHIAIAALGKDEDGQPLSVTHFKLKNAQEKYMLQQEGDEMDAKVKRAEKEILAMENTLRVVNSSNVNYKQSLSAVTEFDKEAEDMRMLETEISNITATVRTRRKDLVVKRHQVKELKQLLDGVDVERTEAKKVLANVEDEQADLDRYTIEQRVKIDRADRHLLTCMKGLSMRACEKYHKNLIIRQLQDANKSALQQLAEASTRYQDMTPHITRYMSESDLCLPGPRLQFTPSTSSNSSSRSSEYYASGPYVSNLLLTFDPVAPCGSRKAPSKKEKRKAKAKF